MSFYIKKCKKHGELTKDQCIVNRKKGQLTEYFQCKQCAKAYRDKVAVKRNGESREKYLRDKASIDKRERGEMEMYLLCKRVFDNLTIKRRQCSGTA